MLAKLYQLPGKATYNIRNVVCTVDTTQGKKEDFSISIITRKKLLCYSLFTLEM